MSGYWQRVEPNGRDEDLTEGLQARIADPMWMLARQWQLGEFRGEDAASPIHARLTVATSELRTLRNDATAGAPARPIATAEPLEARVEAESVVDGPSAVMLAAEAGLQFLRRLDAAGLGAVRRQGDWRGSFGLDLAANGVDTTGAPIAARRRLDLIARRGIDGRAMHAADDATVRAVVDAVDPAQWPAVQAVLATWRTEYAARFVEPGADGDMWVDDRLEYRFSVGASTGSGEIILAADEYQGDRIDWYSFRVAPGQSHGLRPRDPRMQQLERLPMPVTYRGQPVRRWWTFEDRAVYFGDLSAGPADLARLAVAEFGTVFGGDWYVVPVSLDVGTLSRVTTLDVIDVFGERHRIASVAVNDAVDHGAVRPWRLFELDGDDSATLGRTPWLLVPPALTKPLDGQPLERVTLVRDEVANLAWGIEDQIELPTGRPMRRREQWLTRPNGAAASPAAAVDEPWRYRLQTAVPPWWIPFVPERTGRGADVRLRRARLQGWAGLPADLVGAKGRLIGVRRALRLFEEEVPDGGIQVTRAWQRARGADGRVYLWVARRKRPGRGDRGSGLEFDVIDRSAAATSSATPDI